jgi:hypothetical protein
VPPLEVPAEAGDIPVTDEFGNAGEGKAGRGEAPFLAGRMKGSCLK